MADEVPKFCKLDGDRVLFDSTGELLFFVPENYFVDVKQHPIAEIYGQYVTLAGIFDWALMDEKGKIGKIQPFCFPSIFMCKPGRIEKVKNYKINTVPPRDYRIFHFAKGDEVFSDLDNPNIIDNVETLFGMLVISGNKMPNTVPYDHFHEYFPLSMKLNGESYNVNMQIFGIMASELCVDPENPANPFRYTDMKDMTGYKRMSIKQRPNYISPYVAFTNENLDSSLIAAVLMDDESKYKKTPLEKIVMEAYDDPDGDITVL